MLGIIRKVLRNLDGPPNDLGSPYFKQDEWYDPYPLEAKHFRHIKQSRPTRRFFYVDGGDNIILNTPNQALHVVRVYANAYNSGGRELHTQLTCLTSSRIAGDNVEVEVIPVDSSGKGSLPDTLSLPRKEVKKLILEDRTITSPIGQIVRRHLEWLLSSQVIEEHMEKDDVLVRDGVLQTSVPGESEYAEQVYSGIMDKDALLLGFAKSSTLLTTTGYPLLAAVQQLADKHGMKAPWSYYPVVDNINPDDRGVMFITKLHTHSTFAFRCEFLKDNFKEKEGDIPKVLGELAYQSRDPLFLGYPYGLIDADRFARVPEMEVQMLRRLCMSEASPSLRSCLNTLNAHDIISRM